MTSAIGPSKIELGQMRVRMAGVTRADEAGEEISSLATPTVAEATAALNRTARVSGADAVERIGSDYRRTMLANGLTPQILIEVQAWGTAVRQAAEGGEPQDD